MVFSYLTDCNGVVIVDRLQWCCCNEPIVMVVLQWNDYSGVTVDLLLSCCYIEPIVMVLLQWTDCNDIGMDQLKCWCYNRPIVMLLYWTDCNGGINSGLNGVIL